MNIIEVSNLSKIYTAGVGKRGIVALDDVSFGLEQGQIVGLLGPNGAGKTTLFKILLDITRPSTGKAMICGLPCRNPSSRQKVGYLPENHRFPEHLTGLGFLELTGQLYGMNQNEIDERVDSLLQLVDMDKWSEVSLRKYSKGMLQRIGLAQAMISDPDVLLLDEPTDGVDPVGKAELREALKKIRDQGKSIVLNSHLLSEVESVADFVVILSRGKVLRRGSVSELTSQKCHYIFEADIDHNMIDIPARIGKKLSVSTKEMIVELVDEDQVNAVLELLLLKRIRVRSVKPLKITLEQSFLNTITQQETVS